MNLSVGPAVGEHVVHVNSSNTSSDPQRNQLAHRPTTHKQTPPGSQQVPELVPVVMHAFLTHP
jgi:hypothetical protein